MPQYEMMSRLQVKYADQPVRFLLFPCNQFEQEPWSNSRVKAFAEKWVAPANAGAGSNVLIFAKSNLNHVPCAATAAAGPGSGGAPRCSPTSVHCCPRNDPVYEYLLDKTAPGVIKWNFDKIIVGKDGRPYAGEQILHGEAADKEVSAVIDELLGVVAAAASTRGQEEKRPMVAVEDPGQAAPPPKKKAKLAGGGVAAVAIGCLALAGRVMLGQVNRVTPEDVAGASTAPLLA